MYVLDQVVFYYVSIQEKKKVIPDDSNLWQTFGIVFFSLNCFFNKCQDKVTIIVAGHEHS